LTLDVDGLIVDLDGVVWIGEHVVPGSAEALAALRARRLPLVFLTNDPGGSRADYVARLAGHGIAATEDEVVTSGRALAAFVRSEHGTGARVFVVGSPALAREVEDAGLVVAADADVAAVAVGAHSGFDYEELKRAAQAARRGAALYCAGRDPWFPMPDGPWPGTGAVVAAVETASGVRATSVGKPEPYIFGIARELLDGCERVAIVGDNLVSDVAGGKRAGLASALVLTGTATEADVDAAAVKPDVVARDLEAFAELL
jgi:HAD superfamily hydrolase (TIGR01450 family)